jgi:hypothetical protein
MLGERGMMVAMGHGLCMYLCARRDHKRKEESKNVNAS